MAKLRKRGSTSNIERFTLKNSSTGEGLTGLSSASSGLIISTICDNEATATTYTVAGSTIETIATLGTYAAPTATKCRFKEVDATNHKGLYEFQFADARYAVASSRGLVISVTGAASLLDADYEIEIVAYDPDSATNLGLSNLDATISSRATAAKLQAYVQLLARSDAAIETDNATELGEINANEGSGAGNFSSQTDSQEAIRDRGDTSWVTATSVTVSDKTGFSLASPQSFDLTGNITGNLSGSVGSLTGHTNQTADHTASIAAIKAITDALTAAAAAKLATSAGTIVAGAAITGTLSTTQMTTDLTEATNDHYNGRIIIWTSGALANQATDITDYTGSTKLLTFTAVTEAPSNTDTFIIV